MNGKTRSPYASWAISAILLPLLAGCGESVNVGIYKHPECGESCCSCQQCCAMAEAAAENACRYYQPEDRGVPLYKSWQDLSMNDRYVCTVNPFWDHERQAGDPIQRMDRRFAGREQAYEEAKWESMRFCIQSIQGSECRLVTRRRNPSGFYLTAEEIADGWRQYTVIPEER